MKTLLNMTSKCRASWRPRGCCTTWITFQQVEVVMKLIEMVGEECNKKTQELSLTSEWLATERARVEVVETSLATKSTRLDESLAESAKFYLLLVETQSQKEKGLVEAQAALNEVEARVAKVEEVLGEARSQASTTKEGAWAVEVRAS